LRWLEWILPESKCMWKPQVNCPYAGKIGRKAQLLQGFEMKCYTIP